MYCMPETFLAKQDLEKLNSLNDNFHGAGESTTDFGMGIVRGRISGGVAILWNKNLDSSINVVRLCANWCIAIQFTRGVDSSHMTWTRFRLESPI